MSDARSTPTNWVAVICWIAALLLGVFGAYCLAADPFTERIHLDGDQRVGRFVGSALSFLLGCGGVALAMALGMVGLILTRRILLMLGLIDLASLTAAVVCMFVEIGADAATRIRWPLVFVLLALAVLVSTVIFVLWRRKSGSPAPEDDVDSRPDRLPQAGSTAIQE